MVVRNIFLVLLPLFIASIGFPQNSSDSLGGKSTLVGDNPVVAMLDSLSNLKYFENDSYNFTTSSSNVYNFPPDYIPVYSDSVYRERIASMNEQSPFEFVYNQSVRDFIELYAVKKRKLTSRILGLAQIYFPLFEEQLDKYNMPLELKYLAVIESALNPVATSRAGARGLWQFMYGTGKVYGLKATSYVDDRFDPYKSTIAACEHLQDLYDIYKNWSLALAAYNSGAGNVNKAIRRSGGLKSYWAISPYLPRETRAYVPAFIAVSYVLTFASEHNLYPVNPGILYYEVDTVSVKNILTFDQISEMLNIPMEEVVFLNPAYKQGVIPASRDNPLMLRMRKKYIGDFINNEMALYNYKTRKGMEMESLMTIVSQTREIEYHTVKPGESLGSIARKYHTTIAELRRLNRLKKAVIKPRQQLIVSVPAKHSTTPTIAMEVKPAGNTKQKGDKPVTVVTGDSLGSDTLTIATGSQIPPPDTDSDPSPAPRKTHTVRAGETLSMISKIYHCSVDDLKLWNNLTDSGIRIGQKLIVYSSVRSLPSPSGSSKGKNTRYIYYTIRRGDNLWEVAQKYDGVTVADIKKLNHISNTNSLKPGQQIKIAIAK